MNITEFKQQAEETIFRDIMTNINRVMGVSKTSFLSTGLMLKLRVNINTEQWDDIEVTKKLSIDDLNELFSAYINPDDPSVINFTFIYKNEKHLKHILRIIEKNPLFFAFHYMRNMQHTLMKHNTSTHNQILARAISNKAGISNLLDTVNVAKANSELLNIFKITSPGDRQLMDISRLYPEIPENMSDIEYIQSLAVSHDDLVVTKLKKYLKKVKIKGKHFIVPEKIDKSFGEGMHGYQEGLGTVDAEISSLADQLYNDISTSTKGTGVGELFAATFNSIKVDTKWFKKLAKSFNRTVYHRTNQHEATWAGINNTFRHIYPSPKHKHIKKTIKLILSIDNSGSMSYTDLQKLLGLFEKQSKRISEIIVLPHTSAVLKEFTLKADNDIADHPQFRESIGTRHGDGGTSHLDVFRHIDKLKISNPEEYLYMSFSDNYSDIEDTFHKYSIMSKLTCYWVSPSNGRPVELNKVPGTNVIIP